LVEGEHNSKFYLLTKRFKLPAKTIPDVIGLKSQCAIVHYNAHHPEKEGYTLPIVPFFSFISIHTYGVNVVIIL
jgi:hypothetical protein